MTYMDFECSYLIYKKLQNFMQFYITIITHINSNLIMHTLHHDIISKKDISFIYNLFFKKNFVPFLHVEATNFAQILLKMCDEIFGTSNPS
jgi:hypothetical protein